MIKLPRMLADLVHAGRQIELTADTVGHALDTLCGLHPELRVHLFDESGDIRQNVMCFHNDTTANLEAPVQSGDTVTILQAVSGGQFRSDTNTTLV